MNDQTPIPMTENGGLLFPDGLGKRGLWTADHRILALADQASGGVNQLIYHGRQPQSANATLLRAAEGALLLSLLLERNGVVEIHPHRFQHVDALPYAWENRFDLPAGEVRSALCAQGRTLIWRLQMRNTTASELHISPRWRLNLDALNRSVNGHRQWQVPVLSAETMRLAAHDRLRTHDWICVEGFRDMLIDADVIILLAGSPGSRLETGDSLAWPRVLVAAGTWSQPFYAFLICADDDAGAERTRARLRLDPDLPWREQASRYALRTQAAPRLQIAGYPFAETTFRLAPLYLEAAKVQGTGALRSTSGGYYFVWGWDNLMPAHELARLGDGEAIRQLLAFFATHRGADGSLPHRFDNQLDPLQITGYDFTSMLFISLLYQYVAETLDRATLEKYYPLAAEIFAAIAGRVDHRGFFPCLGMYPDAPEKLGRTAQSFVSYEIGFWYTTCRMMANLARLMGEAATAQAATTTAECIAEHFLPVFYDETRNALVDAVNPPDHAPNRTYPRYALFPLHNGYGAWLLRERLSALGRFLHEELWTDEGMRMVPRWDAHVGSETVTTPCWFLHFDLYALKTWRRANRGDMIEAWLRLADDYVRQQRLIPELQMLTPGHPDGERWQGSMGQVWQIFAISGWTRGLLEGVVGLETDLGGLTYIPCDLSLPIRLAGLPFRGGIWTIEISGQGQWISKFSVDHQDIPGTLKLPTESYRAGVRRLTIERSQEPPQTVTIYEAIGAAIEKPRVEQGEISATLVGYGEVNLVFYAPSGAELTLDGRRIESNWSEETGFGTASFQLVGTAALRMRPTGRVREQVPL